jgi:hypothetical protein
VGRASCVAVSRSGGGARVSMRPRPRQPEPLFITPRSFLPREEKAKQQGTVAHLTWGPQVSGYASLSLPRWRRSCTINLHLSGGRFQLTCPGGSGHGHICQ